MSVPRITFNTLTIKSGGLIKLSDYIPFEKLEWWEIQVEPTIAIGGFLRVGDKGVSASTGLALTSGQIFPTLLTPEMTPEDIYLFNGGSNTCQINLVFQPAIKANLYR